MLSLEHAIVYDIETTPTAFTMNVMGLHSDLDMTFEVSHYRDDRLALFQWFAYWQMTETPMIGFNIIAFDYIVIHEFFNNQHMTVEDIYDFAMMLIRPSFGGDRFGHQIWQSDRFAPQIDLFKIHHFDNRAKSTSLKALEITMRSDKVSEMPIPFGTPLTEHQVRTVLIPYNKDDTRETKRFAHFSMDAINFRLQLSDTLKGDVLNFNDTKIGAKLLEQRLGDELCYSRDTGTRQPRQTVRDRIRLDEIIFPLVQFKNPEFNRVLTWMRTQTLNADEVTENIKTKGVFTGVHAHVGGIDFHFGTGGIHGSVIAQRFETTAESAIVDIDVASLYPNIAIVNNLAPEHLGQRFVEEYSRLPQERKEWQAKKGKKCPEANSMKLASNGTYGNSNNKFSVFYDPKFTMQITINGQLMLCMLAEMLLDVPTLRIIQINTDGITFCVHPSLISYTQRVYKSWEELTRLTLEEVRYSRMWIRDVNNYIAQAESGEVKLKGAYWYPANFPDDISNAQPPAWHKDFSAVVVTKAAVAHMVEGADIERFVYGHSDPFDFMCRAKVDRSSRLMIGDQEVQRITRYYVATSGGAMRKISPPTGTPGAYKRKSGVSEFEYDTIMGQIAPGAWDERIHTKNRSKYETREMGIESGYLVAECNEASRFDFQNVNYDWYVEAAKKLVIG